MCHVAVEAPPLGFDALPLNICDSMVVLPHDMHMPSTLSHADHAKESIVHSELHAPCAASASSARDYAVTHCPGACTSCRSSVDPV